MRVAIYTTSPADHPLSHAAASWLGRCAFTGEEFDTPLPADALAAARRYGFHGTIRAPFRLRDGRSLSEIDAELATFCDRQPPVMIDELTVRRIGRFLALVPASPTAGLADLQRDVLDAFEPFRRPLCGEEIARRRPDTLTARQRAYLDAWGYPYVLDEFRFHMTLTDALDDERLACAEVHARTHFAEFIGKPFPVDQLALFVEPEPAAPFNVHSVHPLGGSQES